MRKRNRPLELMLLHVGILIMAVGEYFFKFPNHFSFGGVAGLSVVIGGVFPQITPSLANLALNAVLIVLGILALGKGFGLRTAYGSALLSVLLSVLERVCPLNQPLTDEPLLELMFAVGLPAFGTAILFNIDASSGGTDIIAMILKKYRGGTNIGTYLMVTDCLIVLSSFFVFGVRIGLFSVMGLIMKSLIVDGVIESINQSKYFNVICGDPQPICDFIVQKLHRGATVCEAQGAFLKQKRYIVYTALNRQQAVQLKRFVQECDPTAFVLITNTSDIIGRGFRLR